jgi:hypothetical protein
LSKFKVKERLFKQPEKRHSSHTREPLHKSAFNTNSACQEGVGRSFLGSERTKKRMSSINTEKADLQKMDITK